MNGCNGTGTERNAELYMSSMHALVVSGEWVGERREYDLPGRNGLDRDSTFTEEKHSSNGALGVLDAWVCYVSVRRSRSDGRTDGWMDGWTYVVVVEHPLWGVWDVGGGETGWLGSWRRRGRRRGAGRRHFGGGGGGEGWGLLWRGVE